MADFIEQQFGPYRLHGLLGRGGMGSVFSATHIESRERAAIKILAPGLAADPAFRDRFVAEIESLKTLNHPNIVKLYGFGEHDGQLYYAMELIKGTNLEEELTAGRRFTWREVAQFGIVISKALKHAHDHGVIHRDLKPGNLLIDQQETIKLTDFGIAKLFGASLTSNSNVLGTADFMAPEQAAGAPATPRCDLYSLGCVMFALLSGRPPFSGNSIPEVIHKLRYEEPEPIMDLADDVPEELAAIIHELLAKDPKQRPRTALSLSNRLQALQLALSVPVHAPSESSAFVTMPSPDVADRPTVILPADHSTIDERTSSTELLEDLPTPKKKDHFTRVEPDNTQTENELYSAIPIIALLMVVLGLITAAIWYGSRPISVDMLHSQIMEQAETSDSATLIELEDLVKRFKDEFPNDARLRQVEALAEEIELNKLQRRLEIRARRRTSTGTLSPVEQTYLEAIRLEDRDLNQAILKIEGLIALYGVERDPEIRTRRIVDLANKQLTRWKNEVSAVSAEHILVLQEKLDQAIRDLETEPEAARSIGQGIITLYGDRQWAQPQVARARQLLDDLDHSDTALPSGDTSTALTEAHE